MIPGLLVVAVVLGVLASSGYALVARAGAPELPTKATESRVAVASTETVETRPAKPKPAAPKKHVTFGTHESATQACETCHPDRPTEDIACRSCHADVCGKNSKTVADCIACHKTGTTDRWVVDQP